MNYYKRFLGDYQRKTSHLSLAQHGAYNLLLDHYYSTMRPLPADIEQLYRLCRAMKPEEQKAVRFVADSFFPLGDDGLRHNSRTDEELAKWETQAEASRENGKKGGRPHKQPRVKPAGFPPGSPTGTNRGAKEEPTNNLNPESRNQKKSEEAYQGEEGSWKN